MQLGCHIMVFATSGLMALIFRNYVNFSCKCLLQLKMSHKLNRFFSKFLLVFIKELIETNCYGNLFIEEPIKSHNEGIIVDKLVEKRTNYDLSNQEPVEEGTNNLLKMQLIKEVLINPIPVQTHDVSINLVIGFNFLKKVCPKGQVAFQVPPPFTPWLQYK